MVKKNNNNKFSRQRGKQEALPLHHRAWQFSRSNTIFKYSVEQQGPTKLIMEEYFCRSNFDKEWFSKKEVSFEWPKGVGL